MVRTLHITSLVSVAAACAGAVFVLVFGFKPNSEIQAKLSEVSIVEQFKQKSGTLTQKEDKVSPLVTQAKAFALRIDPPPPPLPKPVPLPPKPIENKAQPPLATDVITPKARTAKFDLAGTASYADYPEKSLALLNLVSEGYKWVRQGEKIGQITIQEIKDGSIVLYQNGKKDTELFVPKPQSPLKSLLKSDQSASTSVQRPSSTTTMITPEGEAAVTGPEQSTKPTAVSAPSGENINLPGIGNAPASDNSVKQQESTGNVRIRRSMGASPVAPFTPPAPVAPLPVVPEPVVPEPVLTPEQQMQSLNESISGIKEIMNSSTEGMSEAERQEQVKAWKELLELLESEKKNVEQNSSSSSQGTSDKKEAVKNSSGKTEKK
jgi:hypothetical protein